MQVSSSRSSGRARRQDALRRVAALTTDCAQYLADLSGRTRKIAETEPGRRRFQAALVCEPDHPVGSNAIAVYADAAGLIGAIGAALGQFVEEARKASEQVATPQLIVFAIRLESSVPS
jgi:hypothetical protein